MSHIFTADLFNAQAMASGRWAAPRGCDRDKYTVYIEDSNGGSGSGWMMVVVVVETKLIKELA